MSGRADPADPLPAGPRGRRALAEPGTTWWLRSVVDGADADEVPQRWQLDGGPHR